MIYQARKKGIRKVAVTSVMQQALEKNCFRVSTAKSNINHKLAVLIPSLTSSFWLLQFLELAKQHYSFICKNSVWHVLNFQSCEHFFKLKLKFNKILHIYFASLILRRFWGASFWDILRKKNIGIFQKLPWIFQKMFRRIYIWTPWKFSKQF